MTARKCPVTLYVGRNSKSGRVNQKEVLSTGLRLSLLKKNRGRKRRRTDGKGGWMRRRRIMRKEEETKACTDDAIHYTKERNINKSN